MTGSDEAPLPGQLDFEGKVVPAGPKLRPTDHWMTPDDALVPVRSFYSKRRMGKDSVIDLDPCAGPTTNLAWHANWRGGDPSEDGLTLDWAIMAPDPTQVFVNPPYSAGNLKRWMAKCRLEAQRGNVEIVALIPADTSTIWFHEIVLPSVSALCFRKGRVAFKSPDGKKKHSSPFGSLYAYWGGLPVRFVESFCDHGWCVVDPHRFWRTHRE